MRSHVRDRDLATSLSLLSRAASRGGDFDVVEICKYLVEELGVDPEARDGLSQTALFYAAKGTPATISYLVGRRADPSSSDIIDHTPLFYASMATS